MSVLFREPTVLGRFQSLGSDSINASQAQDQTVASGAPVIPASPTVASSAYGFSANLAFAGAYTSAGPTAAVAGEGPPAYDKIKTAASTQRQWNLNQQSRINPVLTLSASILASEVSAPGIGVDAASASGKTTLGSINLVVSDNPLAPGIAGVLGLSVMATDVQSASHVGVVFPDRAFATGTASMGSLTISGALIGRALSFSGNAAPNTVLFRSPTVTVTLNKQVVPGPLSGPTADPRSNPTLALPTAITTEAIDISLHEAKLFSLPADGDIVIGESHAGAPFLITPLMKVASRATSGAAPTTSQMTAQDFGPAFGSPSAPSGGAQMALPQEPSAGAIGTVPALFSADHTSGAGGLLWPSGLDHH